jgi:hypothetical protein
MQLRRPPGTKLLWDEEIGQGNLKYHEISIKQMQKA